MKKFFLWLLIAAVFFTALAGYQSLTLTSEETQGAENSTPSLGDGTLDVDISTLPLEEAYAYAVKKYEEDPENHRDLCDLQIETSHIVEIDGKYYQSFIALYADIRYIWICNAEFPRESIAKWDWYAVGTTEEYSLDLLGKVDEGRRDYPPSSSQTEELLDVDISTLPLEEAYAYAVKKYEEDPQNHRDLCDLQMETGQIIEIDGKYYQSYVASNVDIRYIWISQPEFPDERASLWDWYTVGTAKEYSMELLGKVDEGRRD